MIHYFNDLEQGSDEWLAARCGLLTASEMKLIITPTLKIANNDKVKMHLYELCAQRITRYVEPSYISDDMVRGNFDEIEARNIYNDKISPVTQMGFIMNDSFGFSIGYSPDWLVGEEGQAECKSRRQKYQLQTIATDTIDSDYMIQLQTGLLVSERKWCDFIQYSGGMPLYVKRVFPDPEIQKAIIEAASKFEQDAKKIIEDYYNQSEKYIMTERKFYDTEINL